MDSSVASRTKSNSNVSINGIVPIFTRAKFMATYLHQNFSLPDSIMFYIAKNPKSANLYQKMIQTCKYFFVKNPILIISDLCYKKGECRFNYTKASFNLFKFTCKFWINGQLLVKTKESINNRTENQNIISSIIPRLYQCNAKYVTLSNQIIPFGDLPFLISVAEHIRFDKITVQNENGSNVAVEKIVEFAVKAIGIHVINPTITSETMKELINIPHFSKLCYFNLTELTEAFDTEAFYVYMKKNRRTKFSFSFNDSISDACKNRLEKIINEILATKSFNYKPPYLWFFGLNHQKSRNLERIYYSH